MLLLPRSLVYLAECRTVLQGRQWQLLHQLACLAMVQAGALLHLLAVVGNLPKLVTCWVQQILSLLQACRQ
jgi:hypothetical protein